MKLSCSGKNCKNESDYVRPITYHNWARSDAYGIYTGIYCDDCYKNNYPYRRDRYHDPGYCGEVLEGEE